ncbi:PREDICTED: enoyl-CoA delta isomerase 1, mitochondrial-like [Rhagoletis zephyria]|uniref:enoyl-CoA delta isomerase 1, mitochondrial-like n=1 Tax=Rhagoletis zephyria TaxID=28612 RepID=UPI00081153B9|nr:PREDICTED: enoyl-CoA delta isomerase 1, mitochondrial-like [Rhagoletis zephyria]
MYILRTSRFAASTSAPRQFLSALRSMSSVDAQYTKLEVNEKTGIATLTLNRPPVNSLNLELLTDIRNCIKDAESNKCKGLILTSSSNSVFSAGLDILEMYQPKEERLKSFWTTLQSTWMALYGSKLPTAAAINGHAPAGGCLLAASCEYRVMLPKFTIGLNETRLGIMAPNWFMASFLNVLPRRIAELALTQGRMFTTVEAQQAGLVDDVVNTKEEALAKCEEFFASFKQVSPYARALTKQQFRVKELQDLEEHREQDLQLFIDTITKPGTQKALGLYLESLKKKA